MCSWCWGFAPVLEQLTGQLPGQVRLRRLLGGLAPDTDAPMPDEMRARIRSTWQRIMETVPGTGFNFDFWTRCEPRRSTYAACRAVIAAREQGAQYDRVMNTAIQRAYYTAARNPSDVATLVALAGEIGLDTGRFGTVLDSASTQRILAEEMDRCAALRIYSYPALVLESGDSQWHIPVDYHSAQPVLELIDDLLTQE